MKRITLILFALLTVLAVAAKSPIVGAWETKWINEPSDDRSFKIKSQDKFVFNEDNTFSIKSSMQMTIFNKPMSADCFFYLTAQGTYTYEGSEIAIHIDKATIKVEFPEDEIRINGIHDMDQIGMIRAELVSYMSQMIPQFEKSVDDFSLTDVVVGEKSFTCIDDEEQKEYFRKKK